MLTIQSVRICCLQTLWCSFVMHRRLSQIVAYGPLVAAPAIVGLMPII
jgi:hypothetical protein